MADRRPSASGYFRLVVYEASSVAALAPPRHNLLPAAAAKVADAAGQQARPCSNRREGELALGAWTTRRPSQRRRWTSPVTLLLVLATGCTATRPPAQTTSRSARPDGQPPRSERGGSPGLRGTPDGSVPVGAASYSVPPNAVFVSPTGSDSATGARAAPWRTIQHAVERARDGSTVVVRAGRYHEDVRIPYRKNVHLQNYPGEAVWLDGTVPVTRFRPDGRAWMAERVPGIFDTSDPTGLILPDRSSVLADPRIVLFDGERLERVSSTAKLSPNSFYFSPQGRRLYLGRSPDGHTVRTSNLTEALYINHGKGSSIRGIGVTGYATPLARLSAVKGYADDLLFENVVSTGNALAGLSVNGSGIRVEHTTLSDNGQLGLQAHQADDLSISDSRIVGNNYRGFPTSVVAGGVKVTSSRQTAYVNNRVADNVGDGIWIDESCVGVTVKGNLVARNQHHGVLVELSARATLSDNVVAGNGDAGVRILDSNDALIERNRFLTNGSAISVLEGPRTASDEAARGHDRRYPTDRTATWQIDEVRIRNNVFLVSSDAEVSVSVNDIGRRRSAAAMRVSMDGDVFVSSAAMHAHPVVVGWSRWPVDRPYLNGLAQIRLLARQERNGKEVAQDDAVRALQRAPELWPRADSSPPPGRR